MNRTYDALSSKPTARMFMCAVVIAIVALSAGCGTKSTPAVHQGSARNPLRLEGAAASPPFRAQPLVLRSYTGRRVDVSSYRGKAVLVTFIYTHCPDICPLIVANFRTAQAKLGPAASKLQIIAVSVDPRGDTPRAVARFLRAHAMAGRMQYLIGSRTELEPVWKRWGILARADPSKPEQVEHSAYIYGIGASGTVYTLYPGNFKPQWLVHDVPLLARH